MVNKVYEDLLLKIMIFMIALMIIGLKYLWKYGIKSIIKDYKEAPAREKDYFVMLFAIFIFPFLLWFLDYFDLFSTLFPNYKNITREYDWLSFVGSYVGTIVSAFLLLIITEQDRKANNRIMRDSQRPYLDICYTKINREFFEKKIKILLF